MNGPLKAQTHPAPPGVDRNSSNMQKQSAPGIAQNAPDDEATNLLFQALRNHKQKEMEQQAKILSDTKSIAESMLSKRRAADETKTVVSAAASYANNAHYMSINSGNNKQIKLLRNIHPLNPGPLPLPPPASA